MNPDVEVNVQKILAAALIPSDGTTKVLVAGDLRYLKNGKGDRKRRNFMTLQMVWKNALRNISTLFSRIAIM